MTVDSDKVDAVIADIDRRVVRQLEAIRQHAPLYALERTWRALWYVVQHSGDAVVHILQAGKLESPRHVSAEYELIVALHDFRPEDVAALRELGRLNVPVVTSLPMPVGSLSESEHLRDFRADEASRNVVLVATDMHVDGHAVPATVAVAALASASFTSYRWSADIVDAPIPGEVALDYKLSGSAQGELRDRGLVAPVATKTSGILFRSLHTARAPGYFGAADDARVHELNEFASIQLPYRLIAGRFVPYLRRIARETAPEDRTAAAQRWLDTYLQNADVTKREPFGTHMLRAATVRVDRDFIHLTIRPAMPLYAPHMEHPPFFTITLKSPL